MDFKPPRCPNRDCTQHSKPEGRWYRRHGSYWANRHREAQQRYLCRTCHKTFSFQTFRHDRGDRHPELNKQLLQMLVSGSGFRQCARILGLSIHAVQRKHRKLARTCGLLHRNLCTGLPAGRAFQLDEEQTYETASIRPLTVPLLIEQETWFLVAATVGSIRRLAQAGSERRQLEDREEALHGSRPDESSACVRQVLSTLCKLVPEGAVILNTDEKFSYGSIARELFGDRLQHLTTPSTLRRDTSNPLFPINTTITMGRDNNGRLRRNSWLVTKKKQFLQLQLDVFTVYRNYIRTRFNRDPDGATSAWYLGLVPRALTFDEVAAWRQDWDGLSIAPTSSTAAETVACAMA